MILETERLIIAPLTVDDAPLIYPFFSDAEVMSTPAGGRIWGVRPPPHAIPR